MQLNIVFITFFILFQGVSAIYPKPNRPRMHVSKTGVATSNAVSSVCRPRYSMKLLVIWSFQEQVNNFPGAHSFGFLIPCVS